MNTHFRSAVFPAGIFFVAIFGAIALTAAPTGTAAIRPTPTGTVTPTAVATSRPTSTPGAPSATARTTGTPTATPAITATPPPTGTPIVPPIVPLIDLGTGTYKGFEGGLYPGGTNLMPEDHAETGLLRAQAIQPRDPSGAIDPDGKYILLSIGMSNAAQEFCGTPVGVPCNPWSFMGQAEDDPLVEHDDLVILNGAIGGAVTAAWDDPDDPDYDRVRDEILGPGGYTESQVQIVWVKIATQFPTSSLPSPSADAFLTFQMLGDVLRAVRIRYPNIQQMYISSRIYAGYAMTGLNPEPYAYEYGFSVKWLIEAQIDQMNRGGIHPVPGDLNYNTVAPWAAWGPYLWANGAMPRSDGLVWLLEDFSFDGTHPSNSGEMKVAALLMEFFSTSPLTYCWFLAEGDCETVVPDAGLHE